MNATDLVPYFIGLMIALTIGCVMLPHAPSNGRHRPSMSAAEAHSLTVPTINYAGNPNRIGAYVYIMESSTPDTQLDWAGTFIGMQNGMALVRDASTHVVAHVNRDQMYAAMR